MRRPTLVPLSSGRSPLLAQGTSLSGARGICLEDLSAWPKLRINGGTWYMRGAGPDAAWLPRVLRQMLRRSLTVFEEYPAVQRTENRTRESGRAIVKPADYLFFDQTLLNHALLAEALGREPTLNSSLTYAQFPAESSSRLAWKDECCADAPRSLGHPPWPVGFAAAPRTSAVIGRQVALLNGVRQHALPYGTRYASRSLTLRQPGGMQGGRRAIVKAPAWLFSAESDMGPRLAGRTVATHWGALPPPAAIIHFVCSVWPGSDGRRAAMRLWGHWHEADVLPELEASARLAASARARALVAFSAPVPAADPVALMPYLRLLALVALATGRTPVLPTMRCDLPNQKWVTSGYDLSGMPLLGGHVSQRERPCGWAMHHVNGRRLPRPLCVQRPLEGCFGAYATPNELDAHVPPGYWNGTAPAAALPPQLRLVVRPGEALGAGEGGAPPGLLRQMLELPHLPPILPSHLSVDASGAGAQPVSMAASALAGAAPVDRPPRAGAEAKVVHIAPPPAPDLVGHWLGQLEGFDAARRRLSSEGRAEGLLGRAWNECLKMARNNKCAAVC